MNKLILGFVLIAAYATSSAATQLPGNEVKVSTETVQVKDYQSFFAYVTQEEAKLDKPKVMNDTGAVRRVLKEEVEISSSTVWILKSDRSKLAYLSPNNIGFSVIDVKSHHVEVYNSNGKKVREIPLSKSIKGRLAFSDSKLFVFKGGFGWDFGFEIYDNSGKLIKQSTAEDVDGCVISNTQKFFAVTAGHPNNGDFFVLYDIEGNELWRYKTIVGAQSKIEFSLDDKFVIVKMPIYWDKDATTGKSTGKSKQDKFFLFDVVNRKLIAEGNYEK